MSEFASRLIQWQKHYGRHDLPWQNTQDPYAIWISEIMLQQTQVSSAIGYYHRFMSRFPDIHRLAEVELDEVMRLWSGLGYYSRARNLHGAAKIVVREHGGRFPKDFDSLLKLPGVGRSTAAAIASIAFNKKYSILDGNVKRVLARYFMVEGWPGIKKVENELWELADGLLPEKEMATYSQALMDLGATVCIRSNPKCDECPLSDSCLAFFQNRVMDFPFTKPKKAIPRKEVVMLVLLQGKEIMLQKRPPKGIWGGMWSLPEMDVNQDPNDFVLSTFGYMGQIKGPLSSIEHAFSHFKLRITPQLLAINHAIKSTPDNFVWLPLEQAVDAALPAPVKKIVSEIFLNS